MEEEASQTPPAPPEDEPKNEGNGAAADPPEPAGAAPRGGPEEEEEQPKAAGEAAGGEKEEEEAFLVSLYKFMKDRRTPIERIPHLGFKQINLWKIYKAVEKLGAYELVTGRRLWKNVYDELGGSPGSTSAATCTRRHYERLVLPYVRHLKGEDDKPLPPAKPRKQYKVSKEPKGHEGGEKSRRTKKEKSREQVPPDKVQPEAAAVPGTGREETTDAPERGRSTEGPTGTAAPAPSPPAACPGACRSHAEAYKRLFSSFYSKGNHPIMSPLAKKKLLAQVSKAEALHCSKRHCPESRRAGSTPRPGPEPAATSRPDERRSPEAPGARSEVAAGAGGRESQVSARAPDGVGIGLPLAPAVFTGYFHAYRPEALSHPSCPPLRSRCSGSPDFAEPSPPSERPRDLRSKGGGQAPGGRSGEGPRATAATAAFAAVKACWVPPGAAFAPPPLRGKRGPDEEEDEAAFGPSRKLQAGSRFVQEAEGRDKGAGSPGGHQGLAKPKAVVASAGYPLPAAAVPRIPDVYKGAMLRFPLSFGNPLEHLKNAGTPLAPNLPVNPFVIPAFPSPLVAAPTQPSEPCRYPPAAYDGSPRQRLYAGAAWHGQPAYGAPHAHAFHRHTAL
uniref:AT-rich interaction domain 5A n=1 Tax=Apteryx owenii TaxID=8824 RepID=A0A8B9PH16_APTOW